MTARQFFWGGLVAVLVLIVLVVGLGSPFTIDQQDRGVVLANGKVSGLAQPGLNFKRPILDSVVEIKVSGQSKTYPDLKAYSRDQQVATMNVSVSYSIPEGKVLELYSQFGSIENLVARVIDRQVPQAMENVFGQYNAISAVQDRVKLVADLNIAVKKSLAAYPVQIESVQIEGISFSDVYDKNIEARMSAEVAVTKRQQDLAAAKIDAQINVTNAQALADSQLAQARAAAEATRIQGDAEASAIKAKSDALNSSPNLVSYTAASKWNGQLPTTMIPGSTVPFVPVK